MSSAASSSSRRDQLPKTEQTDSSADHSFQITVNFYEDADGGYFALASELPGVGSDGETLAECKANIVEAIQGALLVLTEEAGSAAIRLPVSTSSKNVAVKEPLVATQQIMVDVPAA